MRDVQGKGYLSHKDNSLSGPHLQRFYDVKNSKIHGIKLVDSLAFLFTLELCVNDKVYNILDHDGDHTGSDGMDIFSDNIWVYDVRFHLIKPHMH